MLFPGPTELPSTDRMTISVAYVTPEATESSDPELTVVTEPATTESVAALEEVAIEATTEGPPPVTSINTEEQPVVETEAPVVSTVAPEPQVTEREIIATTGIVEPKLVPDVAEEFKEEENEVLLEDGTEGEKYV